MAVQEGIETIKCFCNAVLPCTHGEPSVAILVNGYASYVGFRPVFRAALLVSDGSTRIYSQHPQGPPVVLKTASFRRSLRRRRGLLVSLHQLMPPFQLQLYSWFIQTLVAVRCITIYRMCTVGVSRDELGGDALESVVIVAASSVLTLY